MMPSRLPARIVVLAGVAGFLIVGCGRHNEYKEPDPPQVTVMKPLQKTVTEYLEFSGMTQPMETVEIRARVKGFLEERHFVEGGIVTQGQLLLVIDEEPFQIQLEAARTRLKEAEAALEQATVSKAREVARAQVKLAESQLRLANQEEQRLSNLIMRKVATDAEMEQAVATRQAREADVETAKARLEQETASYDTTILSCEAAVESARIAVRNADLDLSYCRMHAPIGGRISRVNHDIGNLVGDGESSVLATIVKVDPLYAYATISEKEVLKKPELQQVGSVEHPNPIPVELGIPSQPDFTAVFGKIDYADPSFDGETGTLRTRGIFPNADGKLLPGMFVRMRIPVVEKPNSLLVPEQALGTDQTGEFVLAVGPDKIARRRGVETSVMIDGYRVVEGDLAASDYVIFKGLLRARDGGKVTPEVEPPSGSIANTEELAGRR